MVPAKWARPCRYRALLGNTISTLLKSTLCYRANIREFLMTDMMSTLSLRTSHWLIPHTFLCLAKHWFSLMNYKLAPAVPQVWKPLRPMEIMMSSVLARWWEFIISRSNPTVSASKRTTLCIPWILKSFFGPVDLTGRWSMTFLLTCLRWSPCQHYWCSAWRSCFAATWYWEECQR